MKAERGLQHSLSEIPAFPALIIVAATLLLHWSAIDLPNRRELGPAVARVRFEPVRLRPGDFAPLRLTGAWKLSAADSRFGGISALAVDGDELVALSDSGVIIRFAKPAGPDAPAWIRELPDGPGDPRHKSNRDSEALLRDPEGRGWWVAFENRNQLWLYDKGFARVLRTIDFGVDRWPVNTGVEGLAPDRKGLLLFPERGTSVVRLRGATATTLPLAEPAGRISDAAGLPSGRIAVLVRGLTPLGFSNGLALLEGRDGSYRLSGRIALRVGRLDNLEAVAAEALSNGTTRLWLMSDDNLQRPMRTLLIALDWPAAA